MIILGGRTNEKSIEFNRYEYIICDKNRISLRLNEKSLRRTFFYF